MIGYEFVILREQGDQLAYEVRPTGRPAVVFVSSALTDSSVLFENASHEFPQRIGYQRNGPASMLAWIEGSKDGQTRRFDFPYRQVVCAGG